MQWNILIGSGCCNAVEYLKTCGSELVTLWESGRERESEILEDKSCFWELLASLAKDFRLFLSRVQPVSMLRSCQSEL